jgi:hypothetical protein
MSAIKVGHSQKAVTQEGPLKVKPVKTKKPFKFFIETKTMINGLAGRASYPAAMNKTPK